MSSNLLDNPKLFRHVLENLPVGVYIVDRELRIRFWNHGAEQLTGYLAHEAVGHVLQEVVQACNRRGNGLSGEHCPVTMTLSQRTAQQCTASYLHKNGHRSAVKIRTRLIFEPDDAVFGVAVLFYEAFVYREEASGPPVYGCRDAITGIPSRRLTRAVLSECIAGMEESHIGFGLLQIRMPGLNEFRSKHGPQSVVPFLRTAAQTLRNRLDPETFLGCWDEHEFLAVLPSASPMMLAMTAESLWNLLHHSEISWWGDKFLVEAEVCYAVAIPGSDLESLLREMKPSPSSRSAIGQKPAAATLNESETLRG
jgi:PAS domain S-box-containing protein